jgi:hypothetical protein
VGNADGGERAVRIPEELAREIELRLAGTGFPSLDAFAAFVFARLAERRGEEPFSAEDEARIRDRLRSLGYID